jgi:hypothetical protein
MSSVLQTVCSGNTCTGCRRADRISTTTATRLRPYLVKYILCKNAKTGDFKLVDDIPVILAWNSSSAYRKTRRILFDPHFLSELEARYLYHDNIRGESRMRRSQLGRRKYNVRIYRLRYKEQMARETSMFALPPTFFLRGDLALG